MLHSPRRLLLPLVLAVLAGVADASETKLVHSTTLAGGEVLVSGLLHVRFVGDEREQADAEVLRAAWTTFAQGEARHVVVLERRLPGQRAETWKLEHAALVEQVAARFPPVPAPRPRAGVDQVAARLPRVSTLPR